jgi:hypothetical protein
MGKSGKVKTIVYFENPIKRPQTTGICDDVRLISYWYAITLGKKTANNNLSG